MGFADDLDALREATAGEPGADELLVLLHGLDRRIAEIEAAQGMLLEAATASVEVMKTSMARLDDLERR